MDITTCGFPHATTDLYTRSDRAGAFGSLPRCSQRQIGATMADAGNWRGPYPGSDPSASAAGEPEEQPKGLARFFKSNKKDVKQDDGGDESSEGRETLPPVPYLQLFRFANSREKLLVVLANIAAAGHGAILPMFCIIFGRVRRR